MIDGIFASCIGKRKASTLDKQINLGKDEFSDNEIETIKLTIEKKEEENIYKNFVENYKKHSLFNINKNIENLSEGMVILRINPHNLSITGVKCQFIINQMILNSNLKNVKTIKKFLNESYFNLIILKESKKQKNFQIPLRDIISIQFGADTSTFKLASLKMDLIPWRMFSIIDRNYSTYDFITKSDEDWETFMLTIFYIISLKNRKSDEVKENKDNSSMFTTETYSYLTVNTDNNMDADNEKLKMVKRIYSQILWKKVYIKYKFYKDKGPLNNLLI